MRHRIAALALMGLFLFPLTVTAKAGGFSPGGGFSSGRSSSPSVSPSRPLGFSSGKVSPAPSSPSPRSISPSNSFQSAKTPTSVPGGKEQRAGERTVVNNNTTVVGGGGGGSWFIPAFLGYYAAGGCNRKEQS